MNNTASQNKVVSAYILTVLELGNKRDLLNLFADFGYDIQEPTVDDVLRAYKEFGADFGKQFAKISRQMQETEKFEEFADNSDKRIKRSKLAKANDTLTNEQKVDLTKSIFGTITSWFQTGKEITDTVVNKKANEDYAEAAKLQAEQKSDSTNSLKILEYVGIALLVIIGVVGIALLAKRLVGSK